MDDERQSLAQVDAPFAASPRSFEPASSTACSNSSAGSGLPFSHLVRAHHTGRGCLQLVSSSPRRPSLSRCADDGPRGQMPIKSSLVGTPRRPVPPVLGHVRRREDHLLFFSIAERETNVPQTYFPRARLADKPLGSPLGQQGRRPKGAIERNAVPFHRGPFVPARSPARHERRTAICLSHDALSAFFSRSVPSPFLEMGLLTES